RSDRCATALQNPLFGRIEYGTSRPYCSGRKEEKGPVQISTSTPCADASMDVGFRNRRGIVGRFVLIDGIAAAGVLVLWYAAFVGYNRRRGAALLHWVQAACLGKGRVLDPKWKASSSQLRANLRLSSRWFENARLTICLQPRPFPLQWIVNRWRKREETLTFEADMGFPPGFHLDILRRRWSGHSTKKGALGTRSWTITRPGPVVLTTKDEWPPEMNALVNALTTWREKDFLSVRFNPTSPHFTATVALQNLSDENTAAQLLGLFRELAMSSSAKQH